MEQPLSVKIGRNLLFNASFSIIPNMVIFNYLFKLKNPKNDLLINTNRVMSLIHLLTSIFMYFGKPKPRKNDLIALKDPIEIKEFYSDESIDKEILKNNFIKNNIWHIYKIDSNTLSIYKKIIVTNEKPEETIFKEYNMFLFQDSNGNNVLCYTKSLDKENLDICLDKLNKLNKDISFNLQEYNLDKFDWGIDIRYKKISYNLNSDIFKLEKKETIKNTGLSVWNVAALFSFITSFFHFIVGFLIKKQYIKWIESGKNPLRWIEYFFSSGLMMTNFASLGTVDSKTDLLSVFSFTAVTNIFGLALDNIVLRKKNYLQKIAYFLSGFICFGLPFYIMQNSYSVLIDVIYQGTGKYNKTFFINFIKLVNKRGYNSLTKYLPFSSIGISSLYLLFPIIQFFQVFKPEKYKLGELYFIIISLVSKLTLNIYSYYEGSKTNEKPVI